MFQLAVQLMTKPEHPNVLGIVVLTIALFALALALPTFPVRSKKTIPGNKKQPSN